MSHADADRKEAVRRAILRYLDGHPRAADSAAGVCQWWLPGEGVSETPEVVEEVLDGLAAAGRVRALDLPGGTRVYAGPDAGAPDA